MRLQYIGGPTPIHGGSHLFRIYHYAAYTGCHEISRVVETRCMANIIVTVLAIILCLINAAMWTFVSEMPLAGIGWILAAGGCVWLQKWSRGI